MKHFIATFMFSLFSLTVVAQTETANEDFVNMKGSILNEVEITKGLKSATVIEFEILEFSNPTYTQKYIGVISCCTDAAEEKFYKVGTIYEVKLRGNKSEDSYSISNLDKLEKYKLERNL
jgi:hypothetical protein